MIQSLRLSGLVACEKHREPLVTICVAPQCYNFRQMCRECVKDDIKHAKMHRNRDEAYTEIQAEIDTLFKGLKALRKKIIHTMDTKINSQQGLNEIEEKLEQIKKILNSKLDSFHYQLKKIYEKNIKQKMNELFIIVEKSYEFLEEEKIKLFKKEILKPFFVNDLSHDLKYYESHYDEILEKNVRQFKTGFEHDKVLKLMVNFEQNLAEIFNFDAPEKIRYDPHLFYSNTQSNYIYRLRNNSFTKQELKFHLNEDSWIGVIQSVYYSPKSYYYLFGAGERESNKIRRLQLETKEIKDIEVKMQSKRKNFSICLFNHEIFIVGGENSKEGCLVKCQKFVPSEGKIYIVSSLNQKSAQHTLCTYKNKFILKFGGTDMMESILQIYYERFHPLNPQIYSAETEEWRMIEFPTRNLLSGPKSMINFGLWPGVFCSEAGDKIVVLEGDVMKRKNVRNRYDMVLETATRQLKQLKISESIIPLTYKNEVFSACYFETEDGRISFAVLGENRLNHFYVASFAL